jgi:methyl-accepting chemotaxis protein
MKIEIVDCLSEMVKKNFGEDKWREICEKAGFNNRAKYIKGMDILDQKVFEIVEKTCEVLQINMAQAADAFGDYWINVYALKYYKGYYGKFTSAKEFILGMDSIHVEVTRIIENAHPPRFKTEIISENKIKVKYISERKMILFYIGLVKGIAKYFNEKINIEQLSEEDVMIEFLGKT